jgi:hypothetical protein
MNNILGTAREYRLECARKATAHQISAEYHRKRGLLYGGLAEIITAVLGTSVFVSLLSKFGIGDKVDLSRPTSLGASWVFFVS